jgi:hypothetical protein
MFEEMIEIHSPSFESLGSMVGCVCAAQRASRLDCRQQLNPQFYGLL